MSKLARPALTMGLLDEAMRGAFPGIIDGLAREVTSALYREAEKSGIPQPVGLRAACRCGATSSGPRIISRLEDRGVGGMFLVASLVPMACDACNAAWTAPGSE